MIIDDKFLDELTEAAMASPRLRMNYDLRTTPEDGSQRMLNALEPGTQVPIHRHVTTSEVVVILRGKAIQYYYDDNGRVIESILLVPSWNQALENNGECAVTSVCSMMSVEVGRWHRIEPLAHGTVIFECKDGAYEPLGDEDILEP